MNAMSGETQQEGGNLMARNPQTPPGPGVDATGQAVIDPTKNVLDLVAARDQRQDDLRKAESRHVREIIKLRAEHAKELRYLETERVDRIRAVDVAAVATQAAAAENRATTLAGQVASAATAQTIALKAETDPIRKDITELRQSQWEIAGGKQQTVEKRASGANWGLWVGVGAAVLFGLSTAFIGVVGLAVALYVALKK
jgi:hypothetical protein